MRFDKNVKVKMRELYAARHEPEAFRLLAAGYWTALLMLAACMIAGGVAYGVWEFLYFGKNEGSSVQVRSPQSTFTKQQLQVLIQKFEERADQYEERRVAPSSARDPS